MAIVNKNLLKIIDTFLGLTMRTVLFVTFLLFVTGCYCSLTTNSWAGANFYYLWACNDTDITYYLDTMVSANMKVLRIFILHSCTETTESCQGPNTCQPLLFDVEDPVGVWHDEVLERIDKLMWLCYLRDIKLTIALHDRWSLGCWRYV